MLFDNQEDTFHLVLMLQYPVQSRLDDLFAGLNAAPAVRPHLLHYIINFDGQFLIVIQIVVEGATPRCVQTSGVSSACPASTLLASSAMRLR